MKSRSGKDTTTDDAGSGKVLQKLTSALKADGDFPVRARVVSELRMLASDPDTSIGKISEIILREPSLGTRVLHLVNSAYFRRAVPITTVSQAVLQIGMKSLVDLCAGLILMQKLIPAAKRGGIFADNLKKSILTSLITSSLGSESSESGVAERGFLAGTFHTMGNLLLAYYFPQVFEAAHKRARARGYSIEQSVSELVGVSREELSLTVIDALSIPKYYREIIHEAYGMQSKDAGPNSALANALRAADMIAEVIVYGGSVAALEKTLEVVKQECFYRQEQIDSLIAKLPAIFDSHCQFIEATFLTLPDFILSVGKNHGVEEVPVEGESADEITCYINEVRQAIKAGESLSSIITTVMEALAFGLNYERVLLMLADDSGSFLEGRMALGTGVTYDPTSVLRVIAELDADTSPDIAAYNSGLPAIFGDPVFKDGWPFAAVPIGAQNRSVGVIYADMKDAGPKVKPVNSKTEAALTLLAELLDKAVVANN